MRSLYLVFSFCFACIWNVNAQEIIPPWVPITKSEIPDSIYDQEMIDLEYENAAIAGEEIRYIFFVKFQFWEATQKLENGQFWTKFHIQREPDSIEIVNIRLSTFSQSDNFVTISGISLDYPLSSSLFTVSKDTSTNEVTVLGDVSAMPSVYNFREFNKSERYGYFVQLIGNYHPPVSTSSIIINKFLVYPNPCLNEISIEIPKLAQGIVSSYELYDYSGKLMSSGSWLKNSDKMTLDLSDGLKANKYIIILKDKENAIIAREIIVKSS